MHEPPKNNLGCNVRKTVHYSLNQILSYIAYASSIAACAAASLAIGTRNGEQLT